MTLPQYGGWKLNALKFSHVSLHVPKLLLQYE